MSLDLERLREGEMTKSDLIALLAADQTSLSERDVELAVKAMLQQMSNALTLGERIEIRGFGSFSLRSRPPRIGRNPMTGKAVSVPAKHVPHFKAGKELRERVNAGTVA
jgi:integration host factor subunit beta